VAEQEAAHVERLSFDPAAAPDTFADHFGRYVYTPRPADMVDLLQAVPPALQARVHAIGVLGIDREAVPVQRAADQPFTLAFGGAKGADGSSWAMQGTPIATVGEATPCKEYVCCHWH
jgi:hypothetical protein